jgi:hypothetical protein
MLVYINSLYSPNEDLNAESADSQARICEIDLPISSNASDCLNQIA